MKALAARKSKIHGVGVFANRTFRRGEVIDTDVIKDFRGFNNSCEPNVLLTLAVYDGPNRRPQLAVALRTIATDEELVVSYGQSFCNCPRCRLARGA